MHVHTPVWFLVGAVLLIVGLIVYLGAILAATLRIRRQYSSAMIGGKGMGTGAALSAALRYLPALILAVVGVAILYAAR
jgi:hypothetical protein